MFSATLPTHVEALARQVLKRPLEITAGGLARRVREPLVGVRGLCFSCSSRTDAIHPRWGRLSCGAGGPAQTRPLAGLALLPSLSAHQPA